MCVCMCVCHKAAMTTPTDHLSCDLQLLHPLEARVYRECAASMRRIGRDCIEKRIKAGDHWGGGAQRHPHTDTADQLWVWLVIRDHTHSAHPPSRY